MLPVIEYKDLFIGLMLTAGSQPKSISSIKTSAPNTDPEKELLVTKMLAL
jgi:hypothetical protein